MGGGRGTDLATDDHRSVGDSPWVFVCQINDGDVQTGPKEDCAEVQGSPKAIDRQGHKRTTEP